MKKAAIHEKISMIGARNKTDRGKIKMVRNTLKMIFRPCTVAVFCA